LPSVFLLGVIGISALQNVLHYALVFSPLLPFVYIPRRFVLKDLKCLLSLDILLLSPSFFITVAVSLLEADNSRLLHIVPTTQWRFHKLVSFPSSLLQETVLMLFPLCTIKSLNIKLWLTWSLVAFYGLPIKLIVWSVSSKNDLCTTDTYSHSSYVHLETTLTVNKAGNVCVAWPSLQWKHNNAFCVFSHYLINVIILGEELCKIKCVSWFSLPFYLNISHCSKNSTYYH